MTILEDFLKYVKDNPKSTESFSSVASNMGLTTNSLRDAIYQAHNRGAIEVVKQTLKNRIKVKKV